MADIRTIQKAWAKLREAGIDGVLVGTTALQLHGYDVEAPDIDFLTDGRRPPGSSTPSKQCVSPGCRWRLSKT